MGRKKIAIEPIEDLSKRYVAFSKRKDGLFNKAETASRMYGSTIAIFVFSPTAGKLHTFGPVDSLIHQFLLHHQSSSPPPPPPHLTSTTTTTTTTTEGKKRSRSYDDEQVLMMMEEREIKKRKLLTTTTTTEAAATATSTEEEEATVADPTVSSVLDDDDDELKEYLNGFADEIIAGHHLYEEKNYWSTIDDWDLKFSSVDEN